MRMCVLQSLDQNLQGETEFYVQNLSSRPQSSRFGNFLRGIADVSERWSGSDECSYGQLYFRQQLQHYLT